MQSISPAIVRNRIDETGLESDFAAEVSRLLNIKISCAGCTNANAVWVLNVHVLEAKLVLPQFLVRKAIQESTMVFDFASQSGDCANSEQQRPPVFSNSTSDSLRVNTTLGDTTSNPAVTNLPTVELGGGPLQQPVFRTIAKDAAPPVPQPHFPSVAPGQFVPQGGGQFPPVANPFRPGQQNVEPAPYYLPEPSAVINPNAIPQVGPQFVPEPGEFPQPGPKPFQPPKPGPDSADFRDKPIAPGPFAPAPVSASGFSADQVRSILADRDRAIQLNRGLKPTDNPGSGPLVPAPDGRNPFRPDAVPDKSRPSQTDFPEGQIDAARKAAIESGRPLVLSFTRPGCGYCTKIDNEAWPSQKGTVDSSAIRTKVNGADQRDLAQQYGVTGYPTTIVVNPNDMKPVAKKVGFVESDELGTFLQNAFQKMKGGG